MGLGGGNRGHHQQGWHDIAGWQWVATEVEGKEKWVWWVGWRERREIGKEGNKQREKWLKSTEEGGTEWPTATSPAMGQW